MHDAYRSFCRATKRKIYAPANDYYNKKKRATHLNFQAMVIPFYKTENKYLLGAVLFHVKQLGPGIIAHECFHMAMWYERRVNKNTDGIFENEVGVAEERVAYLTGNFTYSFYKWYDAEREKAGV